MADEFIIGAVADHVFSRDVLEEAGRLAKSAPERVTDLHLAHLAHYVTPGDLAIIVKRRAEAWEAIDQRADDAAREVAAQHQAVAVAGAPGTVPITAAALEGLTLKALCEKYPDTPVTLSTLWPLAGFVDAMNERNKERNAKIAMLEARVLELEASAAAVRS